MKITIISHACLLVESGPDRLIIDPWILGSCYWRSWWHYPPARTDLFDPSDISAIYFTHEHPDHLHFPSLRRFPREARILLPRFPLDRMGKSVASQGFSRVEEIVHGSKATVGSLEVFSYQYSFDDSIVVVTDGETTILNQNDAKARGSTLRYILKRHPRIDFLLESHSPAQGYPFCYTADEKGDLELVPLTSYIDSFIASVHLSRPRYAVPFASSVCHLHPESRALNQFMMRPGDLKRGCEGKLEETELVLMLPGDSWERGEGFSLSTLGKDADPDMEIARLAEDKTEVLARYARDEAAMQPLDFETFRSYLESFVRGIPWMIRRAYPARVAFEGPEGSHFVVDIGEKRIGCVETQPVDAHSVVRADLHMLRDAIGKGGLNLINISKRLRVHLRRGGLVYDAAFWSLLAMYELGYFPPRNLLSPRSIGTLLSRWREMLGYFQVILRPSRTVQSAIDSWQGRSGER